MKNLKSILPILRAHTSFNINWKTKGRQHSTNFQYCRQLLQYNFREYLNRHEIFLSKDISNVHILFKCGGTVISSEEINSGYIVLNTMLRLMGFTHTVKIYKSNIDKQYQHLNIKLPKSVLTHPMIIHFISGLLRNLFVRNVWEYFDVCTTEEFKKALSENDTATFQKWFDLIEPNLIKLAPIMYDDPQKIKLFKLFTKHGYKKLVGNHLFTTNWGLGKISYKPDDYDPAKESKMTYFYKKKIMPIDIVPKSFYYFKNDRRYWCGESWLLKEKIDA